jgi:putative transposase
MEQVNQYATQMPVRALLHAFHISAESFYRRRRPKPAPKIRKKPARSLSDDERLGILDVLHEERFVDRAPSEIVATLQQEGRHIASERTFYRILKANNEVRERRNQRTHPHFARPELVATAPNQVWSWDITKLMTYQKFSYLYLYVIIDIFSRYVVGWMLADRESASLAKQLVASTVNAHDVQPQVLTLHADRGSAMRSKLLVDLLGDLSVEKSFNRPHTSNDNPFSEAQFRTLKYQPNFPQKFANIDDGRAFCVPFFQWYNHEHHHSGIKLLTPADVHFGHASDVLKQRHAVKMGHYQRFPDRYLAGPPKLEVLADAVYINPPTKPSEGSSES